MAFQRVISVERKAMISSLKRRYFLNKREMAHTTNFFLSVSWASRLMLYIYKISSEVGHFTLERFKQEIVQLAPSIVAAVL